MSVVRGRRVWRKRSCFSVLRTDAKPEGDAACVVLALGLPKLLSLLSLLSVLLVLILAATAAVATVLAGANAEARGVSFVFLKAEDGDWHTLGAMAMQEDDTSLLVVLVLLMLRLLLLLQNIDRGLMESLPGRAFEAGPALHCWHCIG